MTTIAHGELSGHPQEVYTRDSVRGTRKVECAWADRRALALELLSGSGELYPYDTTSGARARQVSVSPFGAQGGSGSSASYEKAILTVEYGTPDGGTPEDVDGVLLTERIEPSVEALRLPVHEPDTDANGVPTMSRSIFQWSGGRPLEENEGPTKLVRMADYVVTFFELTTIPSAVFDLMGHTNSGSVIANILNRTFAAEELLYYGPSLSRSTTAEGTGAWTLTERFGIRPQGWNTFWRADSGEYERIQRLVPGSDPASYVDYNNYPLSNFALL